jgi:hypothetical protein
MQFLGVRFFRFFHMKIAQIDKLNQLAIVSLDHNALVGERETNRFKFEVGHNTCLHHAIHVRTSEWK